MADVFKFSGGFGKSIGSVTCDLCREENKNVPADGYCQDCDDYLCQSCYNIHKKTRPTQNHRLLNKVSMPPCTVPENERLRKNISTMCSKHRDKLVEYFCKSHSYLGCSACFIIEHRTCKEVDSISEKAVGLLGGKEHTDFKADLESMLRTSRDVAEWSKANISKAKISLSNTLESIKKFRKEINDTINTMEFELKKQAENIEREDRENMISIIKQADDCMKSTLKIQAGIRSLETKNKVCEMYILMLQAEKEMHSTKQALDDAKRKNSVRLYQFTPNTSLKDALKSPGIMGQISMDSSEAGTTQMRSSEIAFAKTGINRLSNEYNKQMYGQSATSTITTNSPQMIFGGAFGQNALPLTGAGTFGVQPFGGQSLAGGQYLAGGQPLIGAFGGESNQGYQSFSFKMT